MYKLSNPSEHQRFTFMLIGIYFVSILILWNFPVLKHILYPFKLITVAFHEFGHALAGKCTGARIEAISVDPNEGGVTKMRGGRQCCVLPAGYIGSAVIGSFLIFCGFNILASKVASVFVCLCLLATLWWAEDWFTRGLTFVFIALFPALWVLTADGSGLVYVVLFLGVMSAMYSLWDIVEDLITRKVNSSDAAVFASRYGCPAQLWGCFWFLVSLLFIAFAVFMALLVW
ncbi:peptidase M50B-like-domain-containing protein [Catenaria anguillulae PL171]|uniref:Peptidase M50B-like-domain-containing protein n=1 Tax=Catenaria anguillulae PL171 TaxID=765915 RepID=A0A1Y2I3M8_9FUNG|nr:peptidase M50B-like-domain-containing protein [Catenaria anguillulae PL171]